MDIYEVSSMDVIINGDRGVGGVLKAPPSKSYTHRYLFLSLLSTGESSIENPLIAGDTEASLDAILKYGAEGDFNRIISIGYPREPSKPIYCRRSGTTLRIALGIAGLIDGETVLDGDPQLSRRPIKPLLEALESLGIETSQSIGGLPIKVRGGRLNKSSVKVSASKSSQFISSLLYLSIKTGISIEVIDSPVSKGYIDMTISCMEEAGVKVYRDGYRYFKVEPRDLKGERYIVPGDYSSAAYLMVIGALGEGVTIEGLKQDDPHPDRKMIEILRDIGAEIDVVDDRVRVSGGHLENFEVDIRDSPDLLPPLAILAAFIHGKSVLKGIGHTRYKETDRPSTLSYNLKAMDIKTELEGETLVVYGGEPKPGIFNSFGDHRIAMSFIVASIFMKGRSIVRNAGVYRDSYPTFLRDIKSLGAEVMIV